jgi:hypothetical protein
MNICFGLAGRPAEDLQDFGFIWDVTFISASLSHYNKFRNADEELLGRDCGICMIESMQNLIDIQAMVPNKLSNSTILWVAIVSTVQELVLGVCAKDIDIILKIWGYFHFMLENEGHIILEYCWRVRSPLGKHS